MFHVHSFSNCMHVCIVLILFLITSVITFTCRKVVPKILFLVRQFVMKSYLTNDTSFMTEHSNSVWLFQLTGTYCQEISIRKKLNLFFINKLGVRRHGRFWYDKETPNAWFNANR